MSVEVAAWIWRGLLGYLAIGGLVAAAVLLGGMKRIDAKAARAPLHVRLLFAPGLVALWPLVLRRLGDWRPEEDRA
jgi:hypothetical protein